jgi:hypothetical protein
MHFRLSTSLSLGEADQRVLSEIGSG